MGWLCLKKVGLSQFQTEELLKAWNQIYTEYISVFGWDDSFKSIIEKRVEIARLRLKKIITWDESLQTFIDLKELQLEKMQKQVNGKGSDIYKIKNAIEKHLGMRVPLAETSVREFYSYLKDISKK